MSKFELVTKRADNKNIYKDKVYQILNKFDFARKWMELKKLVRLSLVIDFFCIIGRLRCCWWSAGS